ncbi:hypothetical protein [Aliarcobacter butzleri]|uniref:hypothetical protein n=1 Tax=Aliarcobacter butzleri TaxID=28197 RepID=UPI00263EAFDD|nr:hypothetical protein [Aliarcobacter butzleri]MDN5096351.1 hypothetical protein [Aliarcobacter butzleri]MDN5127722.1 hypothetical protein [Aliarcobacter butzleri]
MKTTQKLKLNNEVTDVIYPLFKTAKSLISNDEEISTIYSYLLSQATGIERLQKIIYILDYYDKNKTLITDKKLKNQLGHGILQIQQEFLSTYFDSTEYKYIEKSLEILTEIVNVKSGYRYANFDLHNNETFNIHSHICKILDDLNTQNINDPVKTSWHVIDIILKKYISILVNLIWHKKVGNGEITPICLRDYVTEGWQEINLESEIKSILEKRRS